MGMFSKFWNTNARPEGLLGRFALRMMNLTHTPMARWNLSFIDFLPDWTILDVGCGGGKNIARMSEVYRVLKPGGMFMFSYGLESNASMRYWADQIDAMNILPIDEISSILSDTGFENLQTATKGDYTINFRIQKPEVRN